MIGIYVHHHGRGHLHRALSLVRALEEPVTGLSSLPRPDAWPGSWVQLAHDAEPAPGPAADGTAGGRLHWVPVGHAGLRDRMAQVAAWVARAHPRAMVVDVSVEVLALVRLMGVPVVTVAMPGERGDDAHVLGYDLADEIVGLWPADVPAPFRSLPHVEKRVVPVGAVSRVPVAEPGSLADSSRRPRAALVWGAGGDAGDSGWLEAVLAGTPDWDWTVVGGASGPWVMEPERVMAEADVVVTHAGQNVVGEVAALRRPAVLLPQPRPFAEQDHLADTLARAGLPVVVAPGMPRDGWAQRLRRAADLDGADWARWCDGEGARRFAAVVRRVAEAAR